MRSTFAICALALSSIVMLVEGFTLSPRGIFICPRSAPTYLERVKFRQIYQGLGELHANDATLDTTSTPNGDGQQELGLEQQEQKVTPQKKKKEARKEMIDIDHSSRLLLRLDGFEPYIVVTAITGTSSFGALSQAHDLPNDSTLFGLSMNSILNLSTTASSLLGIYSLGVFSLVLLYSKAALARRDATEVYPDFLDSTGIYRYRAFISFRWSLILFVLNIILFSLTFLPQELQGLAAAGFTPVIYCLYSDWDAMVGAATPIFQNDEEAIDEDEGEDEEEPYHVTSKERKNKSLSKTTVTVRHH